MNTKKIILLVAILQNFAFAGLEKVDTLMTNVSTALTAISLVTVTAAFLWVGYKVLFAGSSLRDMGSTIVGALIVASAAEIAAMLV